MIAGRKTTVKLLLLMLATLAIAGALYAWKPAESGLGSLLEVLRGRTSFDSSLFMDKAWAVVRSGQPLFPTLFFQQHVKYIYPTSALFLESAASGLGLPLMGLIRVVVLVSLVLTLGLAGDIFLQVMPGTGEERGYRWKVRALVAALGLLFYPLIKAVQLGQLQAMLTFLFTLAVWLWMRDRRALAGLCIALACSFKPPLALFLLWGVLRREWRFVWTLAVVAAAIQVAAIAVFGWSNEVGYLPVLAYLSRHGEMLSENQSINGFLQRLTRNGMNDPVTDYVSYPPYNAVVYVGTLVLSVVLVGVGLVVPMWKKWGDSAKDFLLFGLISTIASPIVWTHHYGVFYVGCVYLLAVAVRETGKVPLGFTFCFLLLANFFHLAGRFYWVPAVNWIFSYVLFAGLGVMLLIAKSGTHVTNGYPDER